MRETILLTLTFFKALTILIGLGFTFWSLLRGLVTKKQDWKARTMKYFFSTAGLVILLSIIDFIVAYLMASYSDQSVILI
jgi:hypothetical protein